MISIFKRDEGIAVNSELINGLEWQILSSIRIAVKNKNQEITKTLNSFIFNQLRSSIDHNNLSVFNQYIFLPYFVFNEFSGHSEFSQLFLKDYSSYFSSFIAYNLQGRYKRADSTARQNINSFYYTCYHGYISFLHVVVEKLDDKLMEEVFHEYNGILNHNESVYYRKRYDLQQLLKQGEKANFVSETEKVLAEDYPLTIHRQSSLALKSWLFYLYHLNKIDKETILKKEKHIHINYNFFEIFLKDVLFLTGHDANLGLGDWDFIERKTGIVYSPPSPSDWVILGATIQLLRSHSLDFNIQLILEKDEYAYLYDSFKSKIELIRTNFQKWSELLGITEDSFNEKSERILLMFGAIKRRHYAKIEKEIEEQPLEDELVTEFKINLANLWNNNLVLLNLFERFHNRKVLSFPNETIPPISSKTLLGEFKQMFVKQHYNTIYGSGDLGAEFARAVDRDFLLKIIEQKNDSFKSSSYSEIINNGATKLKEKGFIPSLIIAPPEISFEHDWDNSPDFIPRWRQEKTDEPKEYIGQYKNTPIVSIFTRLQNNYVIVCDFEKAFNLEVVENENWFYKMLEISLTELSPDEIEDIFKRESQTWLTDRNGFKITEEEAKIRIASTIKLSFKVYAKLNIINVNAFEIGIINKNN
jgi:hypothetical protein